MGRSRKQPGKSVDSLLAENDSLRQRVKELEEERDTYRNAVYAWAREQVSAEDFRRVAAEKDRQSLGEFIACLEQ